MGHKSYEELDAGLEGARGSVQIGGKYCHWKAPETVYTVLHVGYTEWDESVVVIYQPEGEDVVWVRRLEGEDGWLEPVEEREGDDKRRFVLLNE